jgi:two-component system sensor histidine kinase YesM
MKGMMNLLSSPTWVSKIKATAFQHFSNFSLATKLMLVICSGIVAIFIFLTALMLFLSQKNNITDQKRQADEFLKSGLNIVREEMQYISGIADYMCLAKDIQTMITDSNLGKSEISDSNTLAAVSSLKYAVSIVVYDRLGRVLDYSSIDGSSGPLDQPVTNPLHPLSSIMQEKKSFVWQYIPANEGTFMERDFSPKLCLWKRVQSSKDKNTIGSVAVSVDVRKLLDIGPHLGPAYGSIIIVNEKNEEVFNRTNINLDNDSISRLNNLGSTSGTRVTIGSDHYWSFSARIANTDLRLFYLLPFLGFHWDISSFAVYTIVASALFLTLLIPLFLFITKSITKPLKKLTISMENFSHGDFASRVNFRHHDEVGRLGDVFNSMVEENQMLINSNYVLKLKEKEAELAALHSQINPHFFYNVVNSIQWLAMKNNDQEVAGLIYSFGRIFQSVLGTKQKMSTVRQEVELLNNYLKLQKQCYGNHFDYEISVEDEVDEIYIPRLSLQPLVENSIAHGVHGTDSRQEKIIIRINIYLSPDGKMINLEVFDNGPGIKPEILALLPDKLPAPDPGEKSQGNRLAMKNISERLKHTYNDQHSITIESIPYVKTLVKIVLPVIYADEPGNGSGVAENV